MTRSTKSYCCRRVFEKSETHALTSRRIKPMTYFGTRSTPRMHHIREKTLDPRSRHTWLAICQPLTSQVSSRGQRSGVFCHHRRMGKVAHSFGKFGKEGSRSIWLGPQNSFEIKSRSKGSTSQNAAETEEWGLGGGDFCRIHLSSPHNSTSPKLLSTVGRPTFSRPVLFFLAPTAPELTRHALLHLPNPNVTSAVCHPAQMGEHCRQLFRQKTAS